VPTQEEPTTRIRAAAPCQGRGGRREERHLPRAVTHAPRDHLSVRSRITGARSTLANTAFFPHQNASMPGCCAAAGCGLEHAARCCVTRGCSDNDTLLSLAPPGQQRSIAYNSLYRVHAWRAAWRGLTRSASSVCCRARLAARPLTAVSPPCTTLRKWLCVPPI